MPTQEKNKILPAILKDSAVKRYGKKRAKALEPTLQGLAKSLAAIEEYPLAMEEEPAFAR